MKKATKQGGRVIVLDYNHEKISWQPQPPKSMYDFYHAFLKWRADAGMSNTIADMLPNIFKQANFTHITLSPQHETVHKHDDHFKSAISIWADVAASRGLQMVKDGYITEEECYRAEYDYRQWMKTNALSQTLYLLAVQGIKK